MTGFIVAPYRDRVEILSDGAQYTPAGVVLGAEYKISASDVVPLAMVGSGTVDEIIALSSAILEVADRTGSVDDTLEVLASALAEIGQSPSFDTAMRMAIGAISETRGPICFVFSTFEDRGSGAKPFELQEMRRSFAQGGVPTGEDLVAYGELSLEDGLEKDAAFLMGAMRKQKLANPARPDREPFHSVGCHVDLTVVRTDGYEHRRLFTWPDVVGEKIDPFDAALAA